MKKLVLIFAFFPALLFAYECKCTKPNIDYIRVVEVKEYSTHLSSCQIKDTEARVVGVNAFSVFYPPQEYPNSYIPKWNYKKSYDISERVNPSQIWNCEAGYCTSMRWSDIKVGMYLQIIYYTQFVYENGEKKAYRWSYKIMAWNPDMYNAK